MKDKNGDQQQDAFPKLSNPARRALAGAGYTRLEQLTKVTEAEIKALHGIGPNAIEHFALLLLLKDYHLPRANS